MPVPIYHGWRSQPFRAGCEDKNTYFSCCFEVHSWKSTRCKIPFQYFFFLTQGPLKIYNIKPSLRNLSHSDWEQLQLNLLIKWRSNLHSASPDEVNVIILGMFQQLTAPPGLIITCKLEEEELWVPISPMPNADRKLNRDISRGSHTFLLDGFFLEISFMIIAVLICIVSATPSLLSLTLFTVTV